MVWMMPRLIEDLMALVPEGRTQHFPAATAEASAPAFVQVQFDHKYGPPVAWENRPEFTELPWMGARGKPRTGLGRLPEPDLVCELGAKPLVDFYGTGTAAHLISERLRDLILSLDPNSLELRPVKIRTLTATADYAMVMPVRTLSAIDTARTSITIQDEPLGTIWIRRVRFPDGAVFASDSLPGVHHFADIDILDRWIWSRELVERAKSAGIRGLYTCVAGTVAGRIDSL